MFSEKIIAETKNTSIPTNNLIIQKIHLQNISKFYIMLSLLIRTPLPFNSPFTTSMNNCSQLM